MTVQNLRDLATARVRDAEVLYDAQRFDGAVYLCGYAIEFALKGQICRTLNWTIYPSEQGFTNYKTFQTHDLDVLLHLSGVETLIKTAHLADWSQISTWSSEFRYRTIGSATANDARDMIASVQRLLGVL